MNMTYNAVYEKKHTNIMKDPMSLNNLKAIPPIWEKFLLGWIGLFPGLVKQMLTAPWLVPVVVMIS